VDSPSIPRTAVERFLDEVENGLVEVEDPRRVLLHPFSLSWYRRKVVAVLEGGEVRVVDKEFARKLAQREGVFLEELEGRVRACPTKYLGIDLWRGRVVFTRDVIGVLPCQIARALAYKEGYTAILGKKADEILERAARTLPAFAAEGFGEAESAGSQAYEGGVRRVAQPASRRARCFWDPRVPLAEAWTGRRGWSWEPC